MKSLLLKKLAALALFLHASTLLAHPGHGPEGGLPHAVEHAAWLTAALLLLVGILHLWRRNPEKIKDKKN